MRHRTLAAVFAITASWQTARFSTHRKFQKKREKMTRREMERKKLENGGRNSKQSIILSFYWLEELPVKEVTACYLQSVTHKGSNWSFLSLLTSWTIVRYISFRKNTPLLTYSTSLIFARICACTYAFVCTYTIVCAFVCVRTYMTCFTLRLISMISLDLMSQWS